MRTAETAFRSTIIWCGGGEAESEDEMCALSWERSAAEGKGAGAAGQRTSNINVFRHLLAALRHFSSTNEDKMSSR